MGTLHHWFKGSKSKSGKPGWVQADGSPCANEPGETKTPKCFSSARLRLLKRKGKKGESLIRSAVRRKRKKDKAQQAKSGAASPTNVSTFAKGKKDPNYIKAEPGIKESMKLNEARKDKPGKGSGTKDACYHKVRARYDVWPSAYASGALVKCRKVGASNWGTKSEAVEMMRYCPKCQKDETRDECKYGQKYWDMYSLPIRLGKKYTPNTPHPGNMPEGYDHEYSIIDEKCWTGYKKKGMKTMFGKRYPNCVKAEEYSNWRKELLEQKVYVMPNASKKGAYSGGDVKKSYRVGDIIPASAVKKPTPKPSLKQTIRRAGDEYGPKAFPVQEDWQSVNRKDKTDGLSPAAVKAYRRENPGSKLQTAVTEKSPKGKRAKRRKSFCRRSKGQQDMHNIDCSKTSDKPICKARRRWKC